jgi:hypothetical protein
MMSATDPDRDDGHEGWFLGQESWTFHRWFFQVYGRPTVFLSVEAREARKNADSSGQWIPHRS